MKRWSTPAPAWISSLKLVRNTRTGMTASRFRRTGMGQYEHAMLHPSLAIRYSLHQSLRALDEDRGLERPDRDAVVLEPERATPAAVLPADRLSLPRGGHPAGRVAGRLVGH